MKVVQYNVYLPSAVDTDRLVLYNQGISSYKADGDTCLSRAVYGLTHTTKVTYLGTGLIQFHSFPLFT